VCVCVCVCVAAVLACVVLVYVRRPGQQTRLIGAGPALPYVLQLFYVYRAQQEERKAEICLRGAVERLQTGLGAGHKETLAAKALACGVLSTSPAVGSFSAMKESCIHS